MPAVLRTIAPHAPHRYQATRLRPHARCRAGLGGPLPEGFGSCLAALGCSTAGIGRIYTGVDGYCPLATYLGEHGFCLELALRPGTQHSAAEAQFNVERIVPMAQRLSATGPKTPLLLRLDAGFDSAKLMRAIEACNTPGLPQVDWLIKWNPRSTDAAGLAEQLDAQHPVLWHAARAGKRVALWEDELRILGIERALRRVLRLVERRSARRGQQLIVPEYELEGWSTSLPA